MRRQILTCLASLPSAALAVSPLTVDDADTVPRGQWQFNGGWQYTRFTDYALHTLPFNPVLGLTERGELGVTFGYQRRDGGGNDPATRDASGLTDLTLSTKWGLWRTTDESFRFGFQLDFKFPTASESRGLGSGHADFGGVLVATHSWERTHLDANVGYTVAGIAEGESKDDPWFLGLAVRHELSERWTLLGETYALIPPGCSDASATFHYNGGVQFSLRENLLVSALIGSATGPARPNLNSSLGFTWVF
jgi:hypothetical protein